MGSCVGRLRPATVSFVLHPRAIEGLDVLVPLIPYRAWRLLLECLQCDRGFCNNVIPYFHLEDPHLTLYLKRYDQARQNEGERSGCRAAAKIAHNKRRRAARLKALAFRAQQNTEPCDSSAFETRVF